MPALFVAVIDHNLSEFPPGSDSAKAVHTSDRDAGTFVIETGPKKAGDDVGLAYEALSSEAGLLCVPGSRYSDEGSVEAAGRWPAQEVARAAPSRRGREGSESHGCGSLHGSMS